MLPVNLFLDSARAEIAQLDARRAVLEAAIAAVEHLRETPHGARATTTRASSDATLSPEPSDAVGATRLQTLFKAQASASVSQAHDRDRLLDLLAARGELRPAEIRDALGLDINQTGYLLKKACQSGHITGDGYSHSRVYRLAKVPAAAAPPVSRGREVEELVPVWSGSTKRSPADVLQSQRDGRA